MENFVFFSLVVIFLINLSALDTRAQDANSLTIHKCPYGQSECLVKMYDSLIKQLAYGNKELNIPVLDPVYIKQFQLYTQPGGPMDVTCTFTDSQFYGFGNSTTKKFKGFPKDFDGKENEIFLFSPKYILAGNYNVTGTFLGAAMKMTGYSSITFTNVNSRLRFISKKIEENGEIFAKVEQMKLAVKFDSMKIKHNVSDPAFALLADVAVEYANTNWKAMFASMKESVYKAFGQIWEDIFNQITSKIPYKDLFIDETPV